MAALTIVIPFYNGHATINRLLDSLPGDLPVIVVDDQSQKPYTTKRKGVTVARMTGKGYFTGACNAGIKLCDTDVLILNQDAYFTGDGWRKMLDEKRRRFAMIGQGIAGVHPAWPKGYIHGTFLFARRDAIDKVGLMNAADYPLWGSTCEWQLRFCRAGFKALPTHDIPGFVHDREGQFGEAIQDVLKREPDRKRQFIRTPPAVSVIVPCYNHGKYLPDLVGSLVGGETSLGRFEQQTFASFEVIIVDDASTDDTPDWCKLVASPWKGVKCIRLPQNKGTAGAINAGVKASRGKYITILGADDMRETGSLERLYRMLEANPHSFVYDQISAFANGKRRPDINVSVSAYDFDKILYRNHVHAGIMLSRQAWSDIGGYPENFGTGREDWAVNIGLGVKGYCGILVKQPGYLYRREKHNRTLTNTTPSHHQKFLAKLAQTYPTIYQGARPMGCCGGARRKTKNGAKPLKTNRGRNIPGGGEMVLLKYVGTSHGTQVFYGPETGGQYPAGLSRPLIMVDKRDLATGEQRYPGLLELRERGKPIFQKHIVEQSEQAVVQAPAPPAEPVPDMEAEVVL